MQQLLFRSRWFALIWAAFTLISIAIFVSKGGGAEKIDSASAQLRAQREAASMVVGRDNDPDAKRQAHEEWLAGPKAAPSPGPTPVLKEFIDPATGETQKVLVQPGLPAGDTADAPQSAEVPVAAE